MNLSTLPLVLRTTRHLRWSQVAARARRMMAQKWQLPLATEQDVVPCLADSLPVVPLSRHYCNDGAALVERLERGEMRLLNETKSFGRGCVNWRLGDVDKGRLWAMTLHYHQWLFELAQIAAGPDALAGRAQVLLYDLLEDWLSNCDHSSMAKRSLAWNSYSIATRLEWSIRAMRLLGNANVNPPHALHANWLESLWRQANHLHSHIEWDLRANHLLRDALGLAWAGRFFRDNQSERWLKTATQLAVQQIDEQVLADGGHFERSPMYHLEVMQDCLSLAALLPDQAAQEKLQQTWTSMAVFSRWLTHPDGHVAQFNDGAARYAGPSTRIGGRHFKDTGIVAWHGKPWTLFFDVGEIGPDCQPGHAHADTLTLECSFGDERLFVNPGSHSYDNDARRMYDRSTDAHNTVCIDDVDSSEVWHIFRVGRRSRPADAHVNLCRTSCEASATHTGYNHLSGRPRHCRKVTVADGASLRITDIVEGDGSHSVSGGFLLAPQWLVEPTAEGWRLTSEKSKLLLRISSDRPIQQVCETRAYHPDYGVEIDSSRLTWRYQGGLPIRVNICVQRAPEAM